VRRSKSAPPLRRRPVASDSEATSPWFAPADIDHRAQARIGTDTPMATSDDPQSCITGFWSKVAPEYEAHPGNVPARDGAEYAAWVDAMRDLLPPTPADVLDLATGTGFLALIAARLGHRVAAIDASGEMLEQARMNAGPEGVDIAFDLGDAVAPAFADDSFDAITNRHFIWTLREPERAFRSWRALLRPGGRIVAIDGFWFAAPANEDAAREEAPGLFEKHYTRATRAVLPIMQLASPEPVAEMFRAAGFTKVSISHLTRVHALAKDPPGKQPWYVIVAKR
jgi:ubiquinone/menaquinone biosynthesis C-methylase UbiE